MPRRPNDARTTAGWEHFEHVADVGVHGFGPTTGQAFEQAALALTAIVTDPVTIDPAVSVPIHCQAPDLELLLADWLNAVVYEMSTRRMVFGQFSVSLDGQVLDAVALGEAVDIGRHRPAAEPKGATLTELSVRRHRDGNWHARCVVDV